MAFTNKSFETLDPTAIPGLPDDWVIANSAQVEEIAAYAPTPLKGREDFADGWTPATLGEYLYSLDLIGITEIAVFDAATVGQQHEDFEHRFGVGSTALGALDIGNELFFKELGSNEIYDFSQKSGSAPGWGGTTTIEKFFEDFEELFDNRPFVFGLHTVTEDQTSTGAASQVMYLSENLTVESSLIVTDAIRTFVVGRALGVDGATVAIVIDYWATGDSYLLFGNGFTGPIPSGNIEISYLSGCFSNSDVDSTGDLDVGQGDEFETGWDSNEDSILDAFDPGDVDSSTTDEDFSSGTLIATFMLVGETSTPVEVGTVETRVDLSGPFEGTVQVQATIDGLWTDVGSPLSVPGGIDVPSGSELVRIQIATAGSSSLLAYLRWGRMSTI